MLRLKLARDLLPVRAKQAVEPSISAILAALSDRFWAMSSSFRDRRVVGTGVAQGHEILGGDDVVVAFAVLGEERPGPPDASPQDTFSVPPSGSSTIGVGTERGAKKPGLPSTRLVAVLELGALTGNRDRRRLVVVRPLLRRAKVGLGLGDHPLTHLDRLASRLLLVTTRRRWRRDTLRPPGQP